MYHDIKDNYIANIIIIVYIIKRVLSTISSYGLKQPLVFPL